MAVGRIGRPHGLAGYVEIVSLTDNPARFKIGNSFRLNPPIADRETVEIIGIKEKRGQPVALFSGCEDRSAAEALNGSELFVKDTDAVKPDDTYWVHDLIGCEVVTTGGQSLGEIQEIQRTGGNDIYVVVREGKTHLIPAIHQVVKEIDINKRRIEIEPLPGLLEL